MTMNQKVLKGLTILSALTLGVLAYETAGASTKTITVATDSDTAPFTYKKDDQFKGYDIDVVKAIFKDSKKYTVKYETVAFSSILTGLDAGRYQLAANDFNYNAERAEKYIFSDPISKSNYAIASKDGTSYDSLDDLSGKSTEALAGSNYAQVLEDWNKEHADKKPIEINYVASSTAISTRLQGVETGKSDFILYDAISLDYIIDDQDLDLDTTALKDSVGGDKDGLEYLLFSKDEEGKELANFVNQRLKTLTEDGTLKKLSIKYFGDDFVSTLK